MQVTPAIGSFIAAVDLERGLGVKITDNTTTPPTVGLVDAPTDDVLGVVVNGVPAGNGVGIAYFGDAFVQTDGTAIKPGERLQCNAGGLFSVAVDPANSVGRATGEPAGDSPASGDLVSMFVNN